MNRQVIFVDDGGVLNENARRGPQYARLAGQYLASRLGGTPEAWAAANAEVAERLFLHYESHFRKDPGASWTTFSVGHEEAWLDGMCGALGIAPPAHQVARRSLTRGCDTYVTRRVRAAFPGAVSAIRRLHQAGFRLHTASGEASWELEGYLTGMRIRTCFSRLYGPDQIDIAKASALYYQQVFAHADVAPGDALVVDDSERALNWAAEVGAQTVLCRREAPTDRRHRHVQRLAELPRLLGHETGV